MRLCCHLVGSRSLIKKKHKLYNIMKFDSSNILFHEIIWIFHASKLLQKLTWDVLRNPGLESHWKSLSIQNILYNYKSLLSLFSGWQRRREQKPRRYRVNHWTSRRQTGSWMCWWDGSARCSSCLTSSAWPTRSSTSSCPPRKYTTTK